MIYLDMLIRSLFVFVRPGREEEQQCDSSALDLTPGALSGKLVFVQPEAQTAISLLILIQRSTIRSPLGLMVGLGYTVILLILKTSQSTRLLYVCLLAARLKTALQGT